MMLPIYLAEPSNEPARTRTAASLSRRAAKPPFDREELVRDREHAAAHLEEMTAEFISALGRRGIACVEAPTVAAAAERIAALASRMPIAVTRSAVVGELRGALAARGVEIVSTYGPGAVEFTARSQRFWQLPPHVSAENWATQPALDAATERREVLGLFGVNAASARSGSLYLLQHSQNIGELLRAARLLVFVVAIDKIARDDSAAKRQAEANGIYGADSVLLDLCRTRPLGNPLSGLPLASSQTPAIEVIVLDNGRSALQGEEYESLLTCIGCRACATRCPTYPEFRGALGWSPKDYLWSHLRGENPSLELCTFCGNCEVDCPIDIPIPTMIAKRRSESIASDGRGLAGWRKRIQGEVGRLGKVFSTTAPLSNQAPRLPLAATVMEKVFGLSSRRPLPEFHRDTLERWHRRRAGEPPARATTAPAAAASGSRRVVYYFGCFANYNEPEVGRSAVEVLENLGYEVALPEWKCCGIPLYAKGEIAAARRLVEFNIDVLGRYVDEGYEVVTSCPSCQLALARDYPRLFPSPVAEKVAAHTHFLSRFLLESGDLDGRLGTVTGQAAYHLPCHLRDLGMDKDTLDLLARVPGFEVSNIGRGCCGLSGTFGLERAHYDQSMDIGAGVFAAVKEGTFDLVLTDCGACKVQLEHGTGRTVTHPLEILRRAAEARREEVREDDRSDEKKEALAQPAAGGASA